MAAELSVVEFEAVQEASVKVREAAKKKVCYGLHGSPFMEIG